MTYVPQLINDTDEVRNAFTPALSVDDISENELLTKIELVENYISMVYFKGQMPSKDDARIPALLMVMSRVIKQSNLMRKYGTPDRIKLENYEISIPHHGDSGKCTTWEDIKSWDMMAHEILSDKKTGKFIFRKVND
jgi:hypothetical protein